MKSRVGFIGIGQAGGNIIKLLDKQGFDTLAINSSREDLETLNIKNKILIPYSEGCNHDRNKAKNYFRKNGKDMLNNILETFRNKDIVYVVFSTGGGTGGGIGPILTDILSKKLKDKVVGIVCVLPSSKEAVKIQVNSYECITEISNIKNIASVFILDNNKEDKFLINNKFVDMIKELFELSSNISYKGNIDNAEVIEMLRVRGMCIIGLSDTIGGLTKSVEESIFSDIEKDKKVVYIGLRLNNDNDIEEIINNFGVPYDTFYSFNEDKYNMIILTGLSFPITRVSVIKDIVESAKDKVLETVNNSKTNKIEDKLDWDIKIVNEEETDVDFEEIFKRY